MSHIVIAGPGRTGTSFIMQWLHACGADTGPETDWHPDVRAGFERRFDPTRTDTPRIVKDPWLFTYIDTIEPEHVERLVLPMRRLEGIALSRLSNEWRDAPLRFVESAVYGRVSGGAVYDLSVRTQEDLAARAMYLPLEWAVYHRIPVTILHHHHIFDGPTELIAAFEDEIDVGPAVAGVVWEDLRAGGHDHA